MPNMRLITDNAVDRATVTASTTSGTLVASNVKTDYKTEVHRSTTYVANFTLTWASAEIIGGVALPAVNLTNAATIRIYAYSATSGGVLLADSGTIQACPGQRSSHPAWRSGLDANTFPYGGLSKVCVWFNSNIGSVLRLHVDISDITNPKGYIDTSRIVAGSYWEPTYNMDYGVSFSVNDTTENQRNEAGDLVSDRGVIYDSASLNISMMPASDRATLMALTRNVGKNRNILLSAFPQNADAQLEHDSILYGRLSSNGSSIPYFSTYAAPITIEGW